MKILFTQWFKTTPEVLSYNLYCLYQNLSNERFEHIDLIHVDWRQEKKYTQSAYHSWQDIT
jgi:hypothetical protein